MLATCAFLDCSGSARYGIDGFNLSDDQGQSAGRMHVPLRVNTVEPDVGLELHAAGPVASLETRLVLTSPVGVINEGVDGIEGLLLV